MLCSHASDSYFRLKTGRIVAEEFGGNAGPQAPSPAARVSNSGIVITITSAMISCHHTNESDHRDFLKYTSVT